MTQITLPFSGLSGATSERSRRAAEELAPKVGRRQREALEWFSLQGEKGGTDNGLIAYISSRGGSPNGPRARRIELARSGLLEMNGQERDGCTVWVITKRGICLLCAEGIREDLRETIEDG